MSNSDRPVMNTSIVPIPPELAGLPTIEAEPWFQIAPAPETFLEGPAFDRNGDLFVTSPPSGIVYKITPQKELSIIFQDEKVTVNGSAFHKDGRLFVVCLSGELLVIHPDDYKAIPLYPKHEGNNLSMNDLVFDPKGNMYITDFTGTIMHPTGGVYYVSPDAVMVKPILTHLASPNGISLSPKGDVLWVGESTRNTVTRIGLLEDGITLNPVAAVLPVYHSTGCPGPDSNKVDAAGNLYQCIIGQGRIVVLNMQGIPVANVVIPGRDEGKCLRSSNLAFKPGTDEGYITSSGQGGAWIYNFRGLAEGLPLFSHQ